MKSVQILSLPSTWVWVLGGVYTDDVSMTFPLVSFNISDTSKKAPPAFAGGAPSDTNPRLLFGGGLLFFLGDHGLGHVGRAGRVVRELHGELTAARGHGAQGADVTEHF